MPDQNCHERIHFCQRVTEFTRRRPSLAGRHRSLWDGRWSERDLSTRRADQMQLCSSSTARHVFGRVWRKGLKEGSAGVTVATGRITISMQRQLSSEHLKGFFVVPPQDKYTRTPSLPLYNSAWHEMLCKCPSQNQTETGEAFSSIAEPKGSSVSTAKKGWGFATRKKLQTS